VLANALRLIALGTGYALAQGSSQSAFAIAVLWECVVNIGQHHQLLIGCPEVLSLDSWHNAILSIINWQHSCPRVSHRPLRRPAAVQPIAKTGAFVLPLAATNNPGFVCASWDSMDSVARMTCSDEQVSFSFSLISLENFFKKKLVDLLQKEGLFGGNQSSTAEGTIGPNGTALCSPSDCHDQGICLGLRSKPRCVCNLGFGGPRCESGSLTHP
jgi:hypothetical protein